MQAITEYYAFIRYGKLQIFLSTAVVNIPRMTVIDIFILRSVVAFDPSRVGFFCSFPLLGKVTEVFRAQVRLRLPPLLLCVLQ